MKNKLLLFFCAICILVGMEQSCFSLTPGKIGNDSIIIKKCSDFKITGDGSTGEWKKTQWIDLKQPDTVSSLYQTRVKVLYSEKGIYFLFNCGDTKLTSTIKSDNEDLWNEDVVEVFLWTDEKFPVYFEYELSPYNFELPIIVPNNNGKFLGWLPWHYDGERKIQHATSVIKVKGEQITAWFAEFFIPYKLLAPLSNVPPVSGTSWRANMYRIDYDNGQVPFAWQEVTGTFHEYNRFGTFIFE